MFAKFSLNDEGDLVRADGCADHFDSGIISSISQQTSSGGGHHLSRGLSDQFAVHVSSKK